MSQLPPPNRIEDSEYLTRLDTFFSIHTTENVRIEQHQVTEMFLLYNDKILPRESGRSCGACRGRVYRRLKMHYDELKNKTN